jgi:dynein light intermediate chain
MPHATKHHHHHHHTNIQTNKQCREWTEDGQLWVQYVSTTPATKSDVIALQEQLDTKLHTRQARETGICPIREELYAQCFDELIRQVTINCAHRGLLLLRVRDEIKATISSYQTLYESSMAYGIRKAVQAAQHKAELQRELKDLSADVRDLETKVMLQADQVKSAETTEATQKQESGVSHAHEIDAMSQQNMQLKKELQQRLALPEPEID